MMIKKIFIPAVLSTALALSSCSRADTNLSDTSNNTATATPDKINDFVWKAMNSWYYWQPDVANLADNLPSNLKSYTALINGKTPDQLFYNNLLYNYGQDTGDRFSWIENNNEIVDPSKTAEIKKISGLDFTIYQKDAGNINRIALINYVVPGSPAAAAGLKRGDVITKVNGAALTTGNYTHLFDNQFTITIAATVQDTSTEIVTTDGKTVSITQSNVDENPIAFYKMYDYGAKKIGYLVYNGFESDYNDELNATFAKMKADGVNELILDLRYNGGGSVESAEALAQMITGHFTGQPYLYSDFNDKHNNLDGFDNFKNTVQYYNIVDSEPVKTGEPVAVNSLGLSRIFILQSVGTASASELTINCLGKYIPVTTIGWESVGKFVGSITLFDSPPTKDYPNDDWTNYEHRNKSHNWKLRPIVFSYYPKDMSKTMVTKPQITINPYDYFNTIKEFGDTSDPALKKALDMINGVSGVSAMARASQLPGFESTVMAAGKIIEGRQKLNIDDFERFRKSR